MKILQKPFLMLLVFSIFGHGYGMEGDQNKRKIEDNYEDSEYSKKRYYVEIKKNNYFFESIKKLLQNADPNVENDSGWTGLQLSAMEGELTIVTLFIEKGAHLNVPNKFGNTPLHLAAQSGYSEVVRLLIEKGAHFNIKNTFGSTPLHLAVEWNHIDIVTLLLDHIKMCIEIVNNPNSHIKEFSTFLRINPESEDIVINFLLSIKYSQKKLYSTLPTLILMIIIRDGTINYFITECINNVKKAVILAQESEVGSILSHWIKALKNK